MTVRCRKASQNASTATTLTSPRVPVQPSTSTLAAALSFAGLSFKSSNVKSAQLTLTPHHLFYLLSQIEELDVDVGPMNVRIESIHNDSANYISFLQAYKRPDGRSDADSIHSVSSVRSVMSGMSALWSGMGLSSSSSKSEKARLALENDMKYIYGAFTKLPALRLTPDHRTPLIKGYEQFPFDTAVPLFAFKNLQQLEIVDLDFRSFHGWDRLADQLRLLTIKRGKVDDPIDLLEKIVLDDAEKRRRRSNRAQGNATPPWSLPSTPRAEYARSHSDPGSPQRTPPGTSPITKAQRDDYAVETTPVRPKTRNQTLEGASPKRPTPNRPASSYRHVRTYSSKAKRTGSGSSNSSDAAAVPARSDGAANAGYAVLPASKWQRLVYLSLADNGLHTLSERSIQPLVPSLRSFNLSANLFTEIPESLCKLSKLVSLDLSNCMIGSLQTLVTHPLLAITTLKLKNNRLANLAGIERLPSLEKIDVSGNKLSDPDEAARLAQISTLRRIWVRHNPLTKRFPDYRVRIMNHFRRVPGFTEDIIIDDQPATYGERKQLVERVAELERLAPTLATSTEQKIVLLQEPSKRQQPVLEASNQLSAVTLQQEPSSASIRRKGTKRRIVDLSAAEPSSQSNLVSSINPYFADVTTPNVVSPSYLESSSTAEDKPHLPELSTSLTPVTDDDMAKTLTNNSPTGDEYRRNVAELRLKFGNTWLNGLDEQHTHTHWQSDNDLPSLSQTHHPPKLHHYHSTPPVVNVGASAP